MDGRRLVNGPSPSSVVHRPSSTLHLAVVLGLASSVILLAACTALPFGGSRSAVSNPKLVVSEGEAYRGVRNPNSIVLPQPTTSNGPLLGSSTRNGEPSPLRLRSGQTAVGGPARSELGDRHIVEVRISRVRDFREIQVQAGDPVQVGQVLADLEGYAQELNWDVQLIELELAQAQAKLAQAQAEADAARQEAIAAHAQQVAEAAARVTTLERRVATLQRQQQITTARLAQARAATEYRQRWLDTLEPLQEFDPWGDLPYLVGSQNGPQGPRSDLAYREALAKARYDLQRAELARQVAQLEAADATAQLEEARADLKAARATLERLRSTHLPAQSATCPECEAYRGVRNLPRGRSVSRGPKSEIYRASVRINELRLGQARATLDEAVIRSLVAGQVLDVRIERVDGNEATVLIRIAAVLPEGKKQ